MKVEAAYARMQDAIDGHPYLERERALPGALLALDRFAVACASIIVETRSSLTSTHKA